ncbi:hypothetical protein CAPTEDRAFT_222920 [Capitella teleta]|uniref:VWFD domain-containing protein n=1 Tax=Capitella teleta TaxID=283909 RepID=X2ATR7_CAPTE|nr:hypothetical protein CAPTEDRAFT_222920 [Capitella teleta]|eukprot:ELU04620.1 hypothetical protein CAPTEDRAFT_222920 [Capitella teleta]
MRIAILFHLLLSVASCNADAIEDILSDEVLRVTSPRAAVCPRDHTLACWSCRAEASEDDCILHGRYQPCHDADAVCEYTRRIDDTGKVREVTRGCRSMDVCQQEGEGCTTYGTDVTYCRDCRPGKRGMEHRCVPTEGICTPSEFSHGLCTTSSQPYFHYSTFDNEWIPHAGPCKYQLAGASPGSTLPYFVIYIKMQEESTGPASVEFVELELETNLIRLYRDYIIKVNGETKRIPVRNRPEGYHVQRHSAEFISVLTDIGVTILYDGQDRVMIMVPEKFKGSMSGICGDFNADGSDDLKRRDGLNMQQIGSDAFAAMVQSWQVLENDVDSDSRCAVPECGCDHGLCRPETGRCRCPPHMGGHKCQYRTTAHCMITDDTHIRSYDGAMLSIKGTCKYLLTGTCAGYNVTWPPSFQLHMRNTRMSHESSQVIPEYLELHLDGQVIRLYTSQRVTVNGEERHLPISDMSGIEIYLYAGYALRVKTSFGLSIFLDESGQVKVKVPTQYEGRLCGLCGNYNWMYWDDLTTRQGDYVAASETAGRASSLIAASWVVKDTEDPRCVEVEAEEASNILFEEQVQSLSAINKCHFLLNASLPNNPFSTCLRHGSHGNLSALYFDACVSAVADTLQGVASEDESHRRSCNVLETFADECFEDPDVPEPRWRNTVGCMMVCPVGTIMNAEAPADPPSCGHTSNNIINDEQSTRGCTCPPGQVFDHMTCVEKSDCGCTDHDGVYRKVGENWLSFDCSLAHVCDVGGTIKTTRHTCGTNQVCQVLNGARQCTYDCGCKNGGTCLDDQKVCRCPAGFTGNKCQNKLRCCRSWGSPFYDGEDSESKSLTGKCSHLLSGTCWETDGIDLPGFNVTLTQHGANGHPELAFLRTITIHYHGHNVEFDQDNFIRVDGVVRKNSHDLEGLATIVRSSRNVQFTSPHLVVKSWWNSIEVCIPESLTNALCGLCEDFRQDENKKPMLPDGSSPPGSSSAHRWASFDMDRAKCEMIENVTDIVPSPTEDWLEKIDDTTLCGNLKPWTDGLQKSGPMARCMDILGETAAKVFYESCVFAMSKLGEDDLESARAVSCDITQAMVTACEEAGHTVMWREYTQCYPKCPAGQVYYDQMSACPATCSSPTAPLSCLQDHTDGCGCPDNKLLNSEECLAPSQCGCYDNQNVYHLPGATWLSAGCNESYTCIPATDTEGSKIVQGPGCHSINETCTLLDDAYICRPAVVDGGWGRWSKWSGCSASPLDTTQKVRVRTRRCNDPTPSDDGRRCAGTAIEVDDEFCMRMEL